MGIALLITFLVISVLLCRDAAPHGLSTGGTVFLMISCAVCTPMACDLGFSSSPEMGLTFAAIMVGWHIMLMIYSQRGGKS